MTGPSRGFAQGGWRAGPGRVEHHTGAGGRQGRRRRAEARERLVRLYRQAHQEGQEFFAGAVRCGAVSCRVVWLWWLWWLLLLFLTFSH